MRSTDEHPRLEDQIRYRLLKLLHERPDITQRQLAREMGVSLGKANYCLRALIQKGLVKAANFRNNPNKKMYVYLLTPKGIEEKAQVTARFLQRKLAEYDAIRHEIGELRKEVEKASRRATAIPISLAK